MILQNKNKNILALEWSSNVLAFMKSNYYHCGITVTSDSTLYSYNCTCKIGSNEKINEIGNGHNNLNNNSFNNKDKTIACAHILPHFMKLSIMLFDFLVDDICFEFAVMQRHYNSNTNYSIDENNAIKDSLITLASVALTSRNTNVLINLKDSSVLRILKNYFNMGIE